jgi:hypothetical protein
MPYKVGAKGSYGCSGYPAVKEGGEVMGCHKTAKEAAGQIYAINRSEGNIGKAMTSFKEGDFVIVSCEDEIHVGRVEYVMTTGASGIPGSEYYLETSPDKPALVVRTLEFESDGQYWEETMYLVSVAAEEATKIAPLPLDAEAMIVDGQLVAEPDTVPSMDAYDNAVGKAEKPNYAEIIKPRSGGSKPSNPKLYAAVVQAAKDKFDVYPSAVANSWVVQEYKRRGGTYSSEKSISLDLWSGKFDPRKFNK